ncbi:MAG TPA: hypothetical protein VKK31_06040 [Thermoanaerobaculia bacterium]|nr:hypothetical protein [Thermoanaerobaculia bacterium]
MSKINEYRCLLISPSDVDEERKSLVEVVLNWNAHVGKVLGTRVELVRWESHSAPDVRASPQEILNHQLVSDCHFGIALFWSRLGTPTALYRSGSDEEIRRLMDAGLRVLVYFNRSAIPQAILVSDQYSRLCGFRQELEAQGLVGYYESTHHLREQVQLHLTQVVSSLLGASAPGPGLATLEAPAPDIRVSSAVCLVAPTDGPIPFLSITVQNHSSIAVFIAVVMVELKDKRHIYLPIDPVTGQRNSKRRLEAGDSFDVYLSRSSLTAVGPLLLRRAAVRDAVGRVYYSDEKIFQDNVADMLA